MKLVWQFFLDEISKDVQLKMFLKVILGGLFSILSLIAPVFLLDLITGMTNGANANALKIAFGFFAFAFIIQMAPLLSNYTDFIIDNCIRKDIARFFMNGILNKEADYFTLKNPGNLSSALISAGNDYMIIIKGLVSSLVIPIIQLIIAGILINKYCSFFVISILGLYVILSFLFNYYSSTGVARKKIDLMNAGRHLYGILTDTALNVSVARQCGTTAAVLERYNKEVDKNIQTALPYWRKTLKISSLNGIIFSVLFGLCLISIVIDIRDGNSGFEAMFLFVTYSFMLSSPVRALSMFYLQTKQSFISFTDFYQEFSVERTAYSDLPAISHFKIELKNLCFSYGDNEVIKNMDFIIHEGEKIALKGDSGVGKTTLCKIISGEIVDYSGSARIGGYEIKDFKEDSLSRYLYHVSQDVNIFQDSVRFNLLIANPMASDDEMIEALEKACLSEYFESLPNGLDSMIGTQGKTLSAGQKQRLSAARLFLRSPSIVVMDETSSNLDSKTEDRLLSGIFKEYADKTIIFITHRQSDSKFCQRIIDLQ